MAAWWRRWPDANIGVATGGEAGLVVVDVDPRNGGEDGLHALVCRLGALPLTVCANTGGGGVHLYFRAPRGLKLRCRVVGQGVDFKGEGGYVVAPPSVHASGQRYEWAPERSPWDLPLAELPAAWVDAVVGGGRSDPPTGAADGVAPPIDLDGDDRVARARRYARRLPPAVSGQGGHQQAFIAAMKIARGFELPASVAVDVLLADWNRRCKPPWTRRELEHKARDAWDRGTFPVGGLFSQKERP